MLDKIKDLGVQAVAKAGDAVNNITTSVKEGVGSLANGAGVVTESLNEKAVRASTAIPEAAPAPMTLPEIV